MTSKTTIRCLVLAACASWPAAASTQEAGDTLTLKDGTSRQGTVKESEVSEISIEVDGKTQRVAWNDVQGIAFGDAPELAAALLSLVAGRIEDAERPLVDLSSQKLRGPVEQEALFHLAWIDQGRDELAAAIGRYRKLLSDHPRGRYLRLAADNLVACMVAAKAEAEIAGELDKLAGAAGDAAAEIELVRARYLEATNGGEAARAIYDGLKGDARAHVAAEARLGLARADLRAGKKSEAESALREVTTSAAAPQVLSGAWNGLGELFAETGKAGRDSEKLLDAVYMYLRGVVQYKPRLGESTAEYERALAGAARCFRYIAELETNAERKRLNASRAQERSNQLRAEFPLSIYLDK